MGGNNINLPAALEYMKFWCNIQVVKYPLFLYADFCLINSHIDIETNDREMSPREKICHSPNFACVPKKLFPIYTKLIISTNL